MKSKCSKNEYKHTAEVIQFTKRLYPQSVPDIQVNLIRKNDKKYKLKLTIDAEPVNGSIISIKEKLTKILINPSINTIFLSKVILTITLKPNSLSISGNNYKTQTLILDKDEETNFTLTKANTENLNSNGLTPVITDVTPSSALPSTELNPVNLTFTGVNFGYVVQLNISGDLNSKHMADDANDSLLLKSSDTEFTYSYGESANIYGNTVIQLATVDNGVTVDSVFTGLYTGLIPPGLPIITYVSPISGNRNTIVTIEGNLFDGVVEVLFEDVKPEISEFYTISPATLINSENILTIDLSKINITEGTYNIYLKRDDGVESAKNIYNTFTVEG